MTNPDNIVRVRARNGGRASVYEANGWAQAFTSGLVEGNGVKQNTSADMNVLVGGSTAKPDVVLAENPSGYRVALDLVGQQALAITAPASNSRISAIVAYTDDLSLATTEDTVTGSPASCGLIVVNGTTSATPSDPTDAQIRTAITADGATGSQAAYCVIATILVASNTSTITDTLITNNVAKLAGTGVVSSQNIDFTTLNFGNYSTSEQDTGFTWIDGKTIYKKTISIGSLPNNSQTATNHNISNLGSVINAEMFWYDTDDKKWYISPRVDSGSVIVEIGSINNIDVYVKGLGANWSTRTNSCYVTLYYTKSS